MILNKNTKPHMFFCIFEAFGVNCTKNFLDRSIYFTCKLKASSLVNYSNDCLYRSVCFNVLFKNYFSSKLFQFPLISQNMIYQSLPLL